MADTYIDELIAYWRQYFPTAAAAVKGAEPGEIAEMERLVGRPLPDDYRLYLERMGGYGVTVSGPSGPGSRIGNVLSYYQYMAQHGLRVPPGYVVIAPGDRGGSVGLRALPGREPSVVLMADGAVHRVIPLADSLPRFLFQTVFRDGSGVSLPFFGSAQGRAARHWPDRARRAADALGLAALWFSDSGLLCYRGATAAALVDRFEDGLAVWIWSQSLEEGAHCGDVFGRHLGFRRWLGFKGVEMRPSLGYRPLP